MTDTEEQTQLALLPEEPVRITMGEIETSSLDHEEVQEASAGLVASVKQLGILQPLLVRERDIIGFDSDGIEHQDIGFRLIDGRRRLDAARRAKLATVPVAIVTAGEVVADTMTLSTNALRRANVLAEVEAIHRLAQQGASEKDIYHATRMPIATIRKRLTLLNLVPELMQGFREGKMAPTVAEDAAKLPVASQQRLVEDLDEHGRLTAKDVHAARSVRQRQAASMLPDALFAFDEIELPHGERPGEPVEAQLARELQGIIARLPAHGNAQGIIRHSIAYAAEQLADIATGCYQPTEVAGLPIEVSEDVPEGEVWLAQDGQITGKIVNVGLPPYEGGPLHNPGPPGTITYPINEEERDYGSALDGSYTE